MPRWRRGRNGEKFTSIRIGRYCINPSGCSCSRHRLVSSTAVALGESATGDNSPTNLAFPGPEVLGPIARAIWHLGGRSSEAPPGLRSIRSPCE